MGLRLADYTPQCGCICIHDDCVRLHSQQWCRHWCVVQWVTTEHLLSKVLEQKLVACLEGRPFRYWGSKRVYDDVWEYCLLLCIDPRGDGLQRDEFGCLDPCLADISGVDFQYGECFVLPFRCCAESLKQDAMGWVASILDRGTKSLLFGEETLLEDLRERFGQARMTACET